MCCRPMVKEAFTSYVVLPVGFIRCGMLSEYYIKSAPTFSSERTQI